MKDKKIGIIAGTVVDTQMGIEFFRKKGVNVLGYSVSKTPEEQSKLQILSSVELTSIVRDIIKKIKNEDIDTIIVYCNSMSAAVDMEKLAKEEDIKIITPHNVYKKIASNFKNIGVLSANNQSAAGIERIIQRENSQCNVIGMGILPLVIEIEKGEEPKDIVDKFALKNVIDFYNCIKVEGVILGCTHFSYIFNELEKYSDLPIIDPAELMYEML